MDEGEPLVRADDRQRQLSKRIRIDGSNLNNKRVVFNNDGEADDEDLNVDHAAIDSEIDADKLNLATATEQYALKVQQRLESNAETDRLEKHKKRRLLDKDERAEEQGPVVTLGGSQVDSDDSGSSDSEESNDAADLLTQEELALRLIRG